jgi:hypothetical protein
LQRVIHPTPQIASNFNSLLNVQRCAHTSTCATGWHRQDGMPPSAAKHARQVMAEKQDLRMPKGMRAGKARRRRPASTVCLEQNGFPGPHRGGEDLWCLGRATGGGTTEWFVVCHGAASLPAAYFFDYFTFSLL